MIEAGQLSQRVTIETSTKTEGPSGAPKQSWTSLRTVWASVLPTAASEGEATEQVAADVTYAVRMRYAADVTPRHRIRWRGRVLSIIGVYDPDGRRAELLLTCSERV